MLIPNNVVIYGIQTLSNLVLPDHAPSEPPFQWTQIELRSPSARLAQSAPPNPASQTSLAHRRVAAKARAPPGHPPTVA